MPKSFSRRFVATLGTSIALMTSAVIPTIALVQPASAAVEPIQILKTITSMGYPSDVVSTGTYAFAVNSSRDSVTVIDAKTGSFVRTISLGSGANPTMACISNGNVFVNKYGFGSITKLAGGDAGTITAGMVSVTNIWTSIHPSALSCDNNYVWVVNPDSVDTRPGLANSISQINSSTGAVVRQIPVTDPRQVYDDGTYVWVNSAQTTLVKINALTGVVISSTRIGFSDIGLDAFNHLSSDGTHLWLDNCWNNQITEMNISDYSVVRTIPVSDCTDTMRNDGTYLWTTTAHSDGNGSYTGTLYQISLATGAIVNTLAVGTIPQGSYSDGKFVWVADNPVNKVYMIGVPRPATNTVTPVISDSTSAGRFAVNDNVTTTDGTWNDSTGTYTYSWYRCTANTATDVTTDSSCAVISGATSSTYKLTSTDSYKYIASVVTATGTDATTTSQQSNFSSKPVLGPSVNTAAPVVTDTTLADRFAFGDTISTTTGTWTGASGTYTYKWYRCSVQWISNAAADASCSAISAATASTYVLTSSDVGKWLASVVTSTGTDGTTTVKASAITIKISNPAINTVAPVLSDTTSANRYKVGDTVSTTSGTWTGQTGSYTYKWYRCTAAGVTIPASDSNCTVISAATSSTYTLATADTGKYMVATVTATGNDTSTTVKASNMSSKAVVNPATNSAAPVLTDTTVAYMFYVGDTVSTTTGTWTNSTGTYTYSWYRCTGSSSDAPNDVSCTLISGATSSTYVLSNNELGKYIYAVVSATGLDNSTAYKMSNIGWSKVSNPAINTVAPVLSDVTAADVFTTGDQLSISSGTWTNKTSGYTYAWYRCTYNTTTPASDSSCTLISSATTSTYTTTSSDTGSYIVATVTASGPDSVAVTVSASSGKAITGPAVNTVAPSIQDMTGSAYAAGDNLALNGGTWTNATYSRGYAWYRCTSNSVANPASSSSCTAISGATSAQYRASSNDTGKYIVGVVTATGTDGTTTAAKSNFTPAIAAGSGGSGSSAVCSNVSYAVCDATYTYTDWSKANVTWSAPSAYPPGMLVGYKVYNSLNPSQVFCSTSASVQSCEVTLTSNQNQLSVAPILTGSNLGPATPVVIPPLSVPQIIGWVGSTGLQLYPNMWSTQSTWTLTYTVNAHTCTATFSNGSLWPLLTGDCAAWQMDGTQRFGSSDPVESGWLTPSTTYQVTGTFTTSISVYTMAGPSTMDLNLPIKFSFTTLSAPQAGPSNVSYSSNGDGTYTVKWKVPSGVDGSTTGASSADGNYHCQDMATLSNGFWSCIAVTRAPSPPAPTDFYVSFEVDRYSLLNPVSPPAGNNSQSGGVFGGFWSSAWTTASGMTSTPVIPVAPGSVTSGAASAGNGSVTVTWSAPTSGDAPTSYEVSIPGQTTCVINLVTTPNAALSCTFTGLTNGTSYTATIVAKNAGGSSTGVTASATPVAPTPPGAPTGVTATAGNGQATISWTAPASAGSSAITSYTVTASPGGLSCTVNAPATSCTISGLTNGTAYTFSVVATSTAGNSTPSSASTSVSPQATVPGAPTNVTATSGNGEATIAWTTPSSDGGAPIDGYIVTSSPGGLTCTAVAPDTTCTITGLTNGTAYTFTVAASNNVGASDPSAPSNSVTPAAGPSAPDHAQVTPSNQSATINWKAPVDGATPTRYVVTMNPGGRTCTVDLVASPSASLSCTFTGLTNGVNYSFTISAFTANGMSASDTVFATPGAAPTKPSAPRGVKFRGSVTGIGTVTWKVSGSNGGSPITKYVVFVTGTRYAKSCVVNMVTNPNATLSCSVSGLKPKRFYNFRVKAVNAVGEALSPKARQAIDTVIRVVSFGVGKTTMWSGLYRQAFITAGYIKKFKFTKVTLTGYTNPGGTLAGRTRFTQLRALTVANYFTRQLRAMGVRNVTVIAVGTGASIYKGPALTPLQRKKNRSVATLLSYN